MKKRMIALAIVLNMVVMSGCGAKEAAGEAPIGNVQTEKETQEEAAKTEEKASAKKHSSSSGKEETVYVFTDASGKTKQTIVSTWLKNETGKEELDDKTILKDLKNVKGDGSYKENSDGTITWQAMGEDIYYRGETEAEAPVSVSIRYELDGKEVTPEELAGASGHLKILLDYRNNVCKEVSFGGNIQKVYQPFMMISTIMLDNEKVSNVEIDHGQILNTGDSTVVVAVGMPKLKESLALDRVHDGDGKIIDIDLTDHVEVEMDAENFSLMTIATVATNNALEELKLDKADDVEKLRDSMEDLKDATRELLDGSKELYDGVWGTPKDEAEGKQSLSSGLDDLLDGTQELYDGVFGDLSDGLDTLMDGSSTLLDGARSLDDGAYAIRDGIRMEYEGLSALQSNSENLVNGVEALREGLVQLDDAMNLDAGNGSSVKDGAAALDAGTTQYTAGVNTYIQGVTQAISSLASQSKELEESIEQLTAVLTADAEAGGTLLDDETREEYKAQLTKATIAKATIDQILSQTEPLIKESEQYGGMTPGDYLMKQGEVLASGASALSGGIDAAAAGTSALRNGFEGENGLKNGVAQYTGGVAALKKGFEDVKNEQGDVVQKGLLNGVSDLAEGAHMLKNGAKELDKGIRTDLKDGVDDLKDGVQELKDGVHGDLKDGIEDLKDGVKELMDGVNEYDEEGISKLTNIVDDDVLRVHDHLQVLKDYSEEYTSFAGKIEGTQSKVKFIFKTDAIGDE